MTGEGGAIFSQGELLFTDLTSLTIQNNLSQLSGGAIFGGSTISLSGITKATFSCNSAEVPAPVKKPTEPKAQTASETSGSSSSSGNDSVSSPVPVELNPQQLIFKVTLFVLQLLLLLKPIQKHQLPLISQDLGSYLC